MQEELKRLCTQWPRILFHIELRNARLVTASCPVAKTQQFYKVNFGIITLIYPSHPYTHYFVILKYRNIMKT